MFEIFSTFFLKNGINAFCAIPLEECRLIRPHLLEREGIKGSGTVIVFAVPYLAKDSSPSRNLSSYAIAPDYHLYFQGLFEELLPQLQAAHPEYHYAGFADHSPIDEVHAAARAGLGIIGKHGLLITPLHSSYVFLGEIITDAPLPTTVTELQFCRNCGACTRHCPATEGRPCLSALTQKKGILTEWEAEYLRTGNSVWGCDVCQEGCPHTKEAQKSGTLYTDIPYFCENRISTLTETLLEGMSAEAFSHRAYAWRGRETVERNVRIIEKGDDSCSS